MQIGQPWLSAAEAARREQIANLRLIFEGKHREYFITRLNTQHEFKAVGPNARRVLYITENLAGRSSLKYADLLFGEELTAAPCDDTCAGADAVKQAIERIGRASRIHTLLFDGAVSASWAGSAWWQGIVRDGAVRLVAIQPEQVFPEYDGDGALLAVTVKYEIKVGTGNGEQGTGEVKSYVRVDRHEKGRITHELWELDKAGRVLRPADLSIAGIVAPEEPTGLSRLDLVEAPNYAACGAGSTDYDSESLTLLDEINNRRSQISRVLDVHGDPAVQVLESLFDKDGNFRMSGKAIAVDDMSKPAVQYITWEAKLEAAASALLGATDAYLGHMEMCPGLVGRGGATSADSWKKYKLQASQTLARVNRKRLWMGPAIQDALALAMALENRWTPATAYPTLPLTLTWSEGLPTDDLEQMQIVTGYAAAGSMSLHMQLLWIHGDAKIAEAEEARILAEREAALPTAFRGGALEHTDEPPPKNEGTEELRN